MQQAKLDVKQRDTFGKQNAKAIRRLGDVPGVLYGRKQDSVAIQINERAFKQFLRTYGENVIINMEITEGNPEPVIIKDIQRHPVEKQVLLHADFIRISLDEPVTSTVPIILDGTPVGLQEGGVVEFPLRYLTLNCLPSLMPNEITVDISDMDIGDIVYVQDIELEDDIEVSDELQRIIVSVSQPRVIVEEVVEEVEGEEGEEGAPAEDAEEERTEPELISRRRSDDEDEDAQ
ncbi:50S ribosomal protein L25 [Candidatus Poribacteria bacterium]|nr:50S ribosomal protein L25 [Candidatus Poribacteria bacterium]